MTTPIAPRIAAALLACGTASIALADTTLTLTPTSSRCVTIRDDRGTTTQSSAACSPSPSTPFTVGSSIGTSSMAQSFIELTYQFTYRDDGLALPAPVVLETADYIARGGTVSGLPPRVSFESATLAVDVTSTFGPNPSGPGYVIGAVVSGAPAGATSVVDGYLLFGLNNLADSFSGTLTVTVGTTAFSFNDFANVTGVSVAPAVAAIPEPSTVVLLLAGLAPLGLLRRRRGTHGSVDDLDRLGVEARARCVASTWPSAH